MAKGAQAKNSISCKILDVFPDAFVNGKEIRIPWMENGELLQIKCTLTCAKDMVEPENGFPQVAVAAETSDTAMKAPSTAAPASPTEEEKARVRELLDQLGIKEEF